VTEHYNKEKELLEKLTPDQIQALRDIEIFKFYPSHPSIDIKKWMVNK
jgi:hypothetical protein